MKTIFVNHMLWEKANCIPRTNNSRDTILLSSLWLERIAGKQDWPSLTIEESPRGPRIIKNPHFGPMHEKLLSLFTFLYMHVCYLISSFAKILVPLDLAQGTPKHEKDIFLIFGLMKKLLSDFRNSCYM